MKGRHQGQAPLVDSVTYIEDCDAAPGTLVNVRCVDRDTYDLVTTAADVAQPAPVSLPILDI